MFDIFNIFYRITYPINYFLQFIGRFIPGGKSLSGISLATKVALTLWIPVLLGVSAAIWFVWRNPSAFNRAFSSPVMLGLVILLTLVFPIVIYWMVRLISTERIQLMPDIDEPWRQGVAELQRLGIDPQRMPLMLVLGTDDFESTRALHQDSYFKLELAGVPQGESFFLHWYAGAKAVFLHAKQVTRASANLPSLRKSQRLAGKGPAMEEAATIGGNDSIGSFATFQPTETGEDFAKSMEGGGFQAQGTLTGEEVPFDMALTPNPGINVSHLVESSLPNQAVLNERLTYLCGLLKKLRGDEVPIDGVVVVAPFKVVMDKGAPFSSYIQEDLSQLRAELGSNFPVTVLISEMQEVEGFVNLAAGLGSVPQMARFGKGFNLENVPTADQMSLLARSACESFQQHIFQAYAKQTLDNQVSGKRLFRLLSRITTESVNKISAFLQRITLPPPNVDPRDYLAITGCYFAATGKKELSEFVFLNGVVEKAISNCENTSWTAPTQRRDQIYKGWAGVCWFLSLLAVGGLMVTAYFQWFRG
jgi:hypothetical protein